MRQPSPLALACGGLLAMAAAIGIGRFVYTPILPLMLQSLHWSKVDAGLVASANFLGYLLGAMAATQPIFSTRQRNALLASLLVSAATTAAMAMATTVLGHAILRLIGGAASALVIILSSTLVLERLSLAGRGALSSVHFAGVGTGIMISAAVVSIMTTAGAGWWHLWIASGVLSLIATAVVAALVPPPANAIRAPQPLSASSVLSTGLSTLIVAYGLFGFGYVITATFLVTIVRATPAISALEAWIWILFGFAAMPSVALWLWIGNRIGPMYAFAIACLVEALGVAASVELPTLVGLALSAVLLGGTFMGITALGLVAARQLSGDRPQRSIGLMTASFAVGQMLGPMIAGYLFEQSGSLRVASLLAAFALGLAAILAMRSWRASSSQAH